MRMSFEILACECVNAHGTTLKGMFKREIELKREPRANERSRVSFLPSIKALRNEEKCHRKKGQGVFVGRAS